MNQRLKAYLRLTRPANLLTAISDIWAGAGLAGYFFLAHKTIWPFVLLSIASVFLYAGGVVLNDVFDAALDQQERPERPIPSGLVAKRSAALFGGLLLLAGVALSAANSLFSGLLGLLIAAACILYDGWAKPHAFFGPLIMGLCRGLNLLLGMSLLSFTPLNIQTLAIVPLLYIAAVTLISRGEVHGGNQWALLLAIFIYSLVIVVIVFTGISMHNRIPVLIFVVLFAAFIYPPLWSACKDPGAEKIGRAVKAGVLGLILMDAAWVAAGAGWLWAVPTALLLPLSILVARRFAVT